MPSIARGLLLFFVFTIPWAYSLDLGEPWGNIARIVGILVFFAAIPALLQAGRVHAPGALPVLVLALFLWNCCTFFWSIAPAETLVSLRWSFQKMMVVWLVWELAESPQHLRALLRWSLAGFALLAVLTLADLRSPQAFMEGQMRYAAAGQDPNDVAHFLDLGFPLAALLAASEPRLVGRWLALSYLPLGLAGVLLTASRGGFLAAVVALLGCVMVLYRRFPRSVVGAALALPALAAALGWSVFRGTMERLATIPEQLRGGGLNQRWNIWTAGWEAFKRAPLFGSGGGTFVSAAGTAAEDTAHNAALAIAVSGGLCALLLAVGMVAASVRAVGQTKGSLRAALAAALAVCLVSSLVATVEESRSTWLLLALIALAGRLATEQPRPLAECFAGGSPP
jgi:O-antigen ligase